MFSTFHEAPSARRHAKLSRALLLSNHGQSTRNIRQPLLKSWQDFRLVHFGTGSFRCLSSFSSTRYYGGIELEAASEMKPSSDEDYIIFSARQNAEKESLQREGALRVGQVQPVNHTVLKDMRRRISLSHSLETGLLSPDTNNEAEEQDWIPEAFAFSAGGVLERPKNYSLGREDSTNEGATGSPGANMEKEQMILWNQSEYKRGGDDSERSRAPTEYGPVSPAKTEVSSSELPPRDVDALNGINLEQSEAACERFIRILDQEIATIQERLQTEGRDDREKAIVLQRRLFAKERDRIQLKLERSHLYECDMPTRVKRQDSLIENLRNRVLKLEKLLYSINKEVVAEILRDDHMSVLEERMDEFCGRILHKAMITRATMKFRRQILEKKNKIITQKENKVYHREREVEEREKQVQIEENNLSNLKNVKSKLEEISHTSSKLEQFQRTLEEERRVIAEQKKRLEAQESKLAKEKEDLRKRLSALEEERMSFEVIPLPRRAWTEIVLQLEKMDTRELAWKEYKNRLPSLNCKRIMVAKHFKTGKDMIFVEGQTFRKGNEAVQPVAINNITFPQNAPKPALSARNKGQNSSFDKMPTPRQVHPVPRISVHLPLKAQAGNEDFLLVRSSRDLTQRP
eukprot:748066-Hanusia_phi.AAC.3